MRWVKKSKEDRVTGTVNQSEVKIFRFGKRRKVAYFCYLKYTDKGEDEGSLPPRIINNKFI